MLPRLVRVAYVIGVFAALFLALQAFGGYDDVPGAGASYQVRVGEITGAPSSQDVARALRDVARETGADVGRFQGHVTDPSHRSSLYVVPGSADGAVQARLESGFRHFRPSLQETYLPYDRLGDTDPRGYYLVWGSRADADLLLSRFADVGLDGDVAPWPLGPGAALRNLPQFLTVPQSAAVATACLAVMTMIAGGVVASAQGYGVQRLQGRSFGVALLRDLREVGRLALVTLGAALAVGLAALWFYNRWARLGEVATFAGAFVAGLFVCALVAHVAAMGLTFRAPVLSAIKGHFSAGWALGVLFSVRLGVAVLAATVAFATLQAALQATEQSQAQERWETDPHAVYVGLSGQMGGDDPELDGRAGEMARTAVAQGDAVLVDDVSTALGLDSLMDPSGGVVTMRADACPALMVNPAYLSRQTVLDADSERLVDVDPAVVTVIAPPACTDFAREAAPRRVASLGGADAPEDVPVDVVVAAPGQAHFTYGTGGRTERSPLLRDAVLIVVPADLDPSPTSFYLSYLTQGAVVFPDEATARAYIDRFGVSSLVIGVWSAAQQSAEQYAQVVRDLRTNLLSLGTAIAILLVTAVSVSLVHVRRSAQAVYVRHISGWPWWLSHLPVLAVEAGVLAVVVTTGLQHLTDPGDDLLFQAQVFGGHAALWQAGTAVAIGALGIVSVVLALHAATARLVATRSADS